MSAHSILIVSLLVLIAGLALMTRQLARRARELAHGKRRIVEEIGDLACQSLFLGGLALMQLSSFPMSPREPCRRTRGPP